jgi:hypothetical protein
VNPELVLSASPAEARLRVGQGSRLLISPINVVPTSCVSILPLYDGAFSSSAPSVAAIERPGVFLRAVGVGSAIITVEGVPIPSGTMRAQLGYCPGGEYSDCVPVNLKLVVVP